MTQPAGVYSKTYTEDQALIRTRKQWAWFWGLMVFLFTFPLFSSAGMIGIMNVIGTIVIAVLGLQVTIGYGGQMNLGQSAFMGVGAYVCASAALHWHWPFWLTIPLGGLAAALFGTVFGVSALRVKGFYMALTTIAAQFVFVFSMLKLPKGLFGQSEGLRIEPAAIGSFAFNTDVRMYYLIFVFLVIMTYGLFGLVRSRTGRALVAIRDNDNAAEIIGINVFHYKTLSFMIGTFYAGISGGLWAYHVRYVQADQFTLWFSLWYVGMLIVGGMSSIPGAIIGTIFIRLLQEIITNVGPRLTQVFPFFGQEIVFAFMNILLGSIIILFVIFQPRGLIHRWNILKESYRLWPFPH